MKTQLEKVSTLQRKLNVELPSAVVQSTFNKIYKTVQKDANIKGFRKGKAPLETIKSIYGGKIHHEVVNELISSHYFKALEEHKLHPINDPHFEFDEPKSDKDFSFSASFEVRPEVTLKKYEGLNVEKEKFVFNDKKVEEVLNNIRGSRAEFTPIKEDRAAKLGDTAVIDFKGFLDGDKPLENGEGKDHNLALGSNSFIEGFEAGIVGMKVGSTKKINLKFPDQYHAADIAGKAVTFEVTLKELKEKILPELNDEFLKSIGANETLAEITESIKKDLTESEKKRIEDNYKNNLLKQLVAENPVEVPNSLLESQKQALIANMKEKMKSQGYDEAYLTEYQNKWQDDITQTAKEMIQSNFIIDTIAQKHDLICTQEDIEKKFKDYVDQTGIDIDRIREHYSKQDQIYKLSYMITEEKVIEFLTKSAKIKEVEPKQDK